MADSICIFSCPENFTKKIDWSTTNKSIAVPTSRLSGKTCVSNSAFRASICSCSPAYIYRKDIYYIYIHIQRESCIHLNK